MNEIETIVESGDDAMLKNQKIKLYKFRPLADNDDFKRLKSILETGEFWCSKFSELNDPMEGSFSALNAEIIDSIYQEKEQYKICSFSARKALSNPIMWGYYANGFKGVAIEVEVARDRVKPIKYVEEIPFLEIISFNEKAVKILSTKLLPWEHECEYRFLEISDVHKIKIGVITALYFGDPYARARNKRNIYARSVALGEYEKQKDKILELSSDLKLYSARVENCRVTVRSSKRRQRILNERI